MRLPNNFGSIAKLSGARRRPFVARLNAGKYPGGGVKWSVLGTYKTYNEALKALSDYNARRCNIEASRATTRQVYEAMITGRKRFLSAGTIRGYESLWKKLSPLYERKWGSVTPAEMQNLCNQYTGEIPARLKSLFVVMDDYAVLMGTVEATRAGLLL